MNKKHAATKNAGGAGKALALGSAITLLTALILCAFVAFLVDKQTLSCEVAQKLPLVLTGLSCLSGAWIAGCIAQKKKLIICLLVGVLYLFLLFAVTAFAFHGMYRGVAASAGVILGCSALAGLLHTRGGKRSRKSYYKFK